MRISTITILLSCFLLCSCKGRYRASSSSMENTIMMGENFFVHSAKEFKNNDVVVFNYYGNYDYSSGEPKKAWHRRFYRLVASSGDIVEIRKGELYVNNISIPFPPLAKIEYKITIKGVLDIDEIDQANNDIQVEKANKDSSVYLMALAHDKLEEIKRKYPSASIQYYLTELGENDTFFAKPSADLNWGIDYYGPLKIPSPGEKIIVTTGNHKLYGNIPGIQMGENIIKEKLYFVLGDYRHGAEDSRFIGLISHSKMIGVVKIK